jgi:hypothetical protein
VEGDGPRLVYNPEDGSVELRVGGPAITVDGIPGEVEFERMTPAGNGAVAVWVEPPEAVVLGKMIRYILERVRITEASRETLEGLLPRVDQASRGAEPATDGG